MNSPNLKPCPFCGGEADIAKGTDRLGYWWVKAYCRVCRAGISDSYNPKRDWIYQEDAMQSVVAAWNRRSEAGKEDANAGA